MADPPEYPRGLRRNSHSLECAIEIKFQRQSLSHLVSSRSGGEDETPRMIARLDAIRIVGGHGISRPPFFALPDGTNEQPHKLQSARSRFYLIGITVAVSNGNTRRETSNQAAMSNHAHPRRQS